MPIQRVSVPELQCRIGVRRLQCSGQPLDIDGRRGDSVGRGRRDRRRAPGSFPAFAGHHRRDGGECIRILLVVPQQLVVWRGGIFLWYLAAWLEEVAPIQPSHRRRTIPNHPQMGGCLFVQSRYCCIHTPPTYAFVCCRLIFRVLVQKSVQLLLRNFRYGNQVPRVRRL